MSEDGGAWTVCRACVWKVDMAPKQGPESSRLGLEPREQEVSEDSGRWCVLVLLSEVQQWFGCNIQRPENMQVGFGEEEHQE